MVVDKLKSIKLMGKTIKIIYKELENGDWGECDIDSQVIILNKKCLEDKKHHWWTLVHEVTHMVFELSGVAFMERNEEEAYVRCVENLVIPWVLDNQHLSDKKDV